MRIVLNSYVTMARVNGYKTSGSHSSLDYLAPVQFALMHEERKISNPGSNCASH